MAFDPSSASTSQLKTILNRISDAFYALDEDWTIIYWNNQMADRTERPAEDVIGGNLWDQFPGIVGTKLEKKYRHAMETQESVSFETFLEGEPYNYWVEVDVYPDENGLSIFSREITQRKEKEDELQKAKQHLELITRNTSEAIYIKNLDGKYIFVNDAVAELINMDPEYIINKTDEDLFDQETAEEIRRDDREVLESGKSRTREDEHLIDGTKHYFIYDKFPYRDEGDNIIGIVGVRRDITDIKETELRLKQSDTLFRNSQDAIFVIHVDEDTFRFERVNPAYENLTNTTSEELEGNTIRDVFAPKIADSLRSHFLNCIRSESPVQYIEQLDVPKEGSYWETRIAPVISDNAIVKIVGTTRDITEQKQRESELQEYNQRLQEIVRTQELISESLNDREHVMDIIVDRVRTLTRSDGIAIETNEDDKMVYQATSGILEDKVGMTLPVNESLSGRCHLDGEMKRCDNVEEDDRVPKSDLAIDIGIRSMLLIPLKQGKEHFGTLKTVYSQSAGFDKTDETVLSLLGGLLASALRQSQEYEKKQEYLEQAKEMARTDPLTGLPNRRKLLTDLKEEFARAERYDNQLAFAILDLDHFKDINDRYGHPKGDDVLKTIGDLLAEDLRDSDTVGRYGGEEFGIVLPETANESTKEIIGRILNKLRNYDFEWNNEIFQVTASAGFARRQEGSQGSEDIINRADQALYRAKDKGRDQYCKG